MNASPWYNSLTIQIVLLLTLALLPLGAVAIYQTNRVAAEADTNAQLALLAVTGRAAKAEELIIERAFGAARLFATIASDFVDDPARCARDMGRFVAKNERYSFVGIVPLSGEMICSSTGGRYDFSSWPEFQQRFEAQEPTIVVNARAPLSGQSVFVVSEPFEINGVFTGFVSISIPHTALPDKSDRLTALGLEELITFNADGEILTARTTITAAREEVPQTRALSQFSTNEAFAFQARNQRGEPRTYTVVPIEGSPATVIGVWRASDGLARNAAFYVHPAAFPALMWMAGMGVAMLSIYMLVLRHISRLRKHMDAFRTDRSISQETRALRMPNELQALSQNFGMMTDDILRDEADLENALHEKNVLIKEVHHRVKNNLQLISSIMNMQIRAARADETKATLSSLQDRVRSLATIHRDLYQSQNRGMVDVGELITDVVENTLEVALSGSADVEIKTDIAPIFLYPDQAVPLSLLAAEGMTNIMKYLGAAKGATPWITASLTQDSEECVFTLSNSIGAKKAVDSTGLGTELIDAFALQLGGRIEIDDMPQSYTMRVHFTAQDFVPDTRDY